MVVSEAGIGFDKEGLLARIPSKPISKLVREAREAAADGRRGPWPTRVE